MPQSEQQSIRALAPGVRGRRGVLFITAMLGMGVMLITGTFFLAGTTQQLQDARRELSALHAVAIADGGLNYMVWRQKWSTSDTNARVNPVTPVGALPADFDLRSLNPDSEQYSPIRLAVGNPAEAKATVWIFDFPVGTQNSYQVLSVGRYRDYRGRVRALLQGQPPAPVTGDPPPVPTDIPPIFNHAIFSGGALDFSGQPYIEGSVGSNGTFSVSGKPTITGSVNTPVNVDISNKNAWIGGQIKYGTTADVPNGLKSKLSKTGTLVPFPTLDLTAWKAFAEQHNGVVNGDLQVSGRRQFNSPVVYVKGNVHFSGQSVIVGRCTIIAEGSITMSGQVTTDPRPTSTMVKLALITPNGMSINLSGQADIDAFCYAHGINSGSNLSGSGQAHVYGAIIADSVGGGGQFQVRYRKPDTYITPPPVTPGGAAGGSSGYAWNVASWEML